MSREKILQETFLNGGNASFVIDLYQHFLKDKNSVTADWQQFFTSLSAEERDYLALDDRPPLWAKPKHQGQEAANGTASVDEIRLSIRALMLVRAYRVRGHLNANLDPLGLENRGQHSELKMEGYDFTAEDLDKPLFLDGVLGLINPTLRQVIDKVKQTYCGTVGIEFMHIQHPEQKSWIQERVESTLSTARVDAADKLEILQNLVAADSFERFLHVKYPGAKRFGLEGGESLIPALNALLERASNQGVEKIVFGMAHRGRLSVLANILKKPFHMIFAHFQGGDVDPNSVQGTGDVKYHLGFSSIRQINGKSMKLSLMPNPSHLEAVNPIVLGKVRAEQDAGGDEGRCRIMSVLLHGDAAFAGQGLVAETLELSALKGYRTGGTVHIITNNQIGFTTSPPHSRSSPYSSDLAKAIQAPIFHVNADDPEAVVWVARLAADFQRQFAQDVVIDLICYRRHGHNEIDEPSFTQPLMYKAIAAHEPTAKLYAARLTNSGNVSANVVQDIITNYESELRQEFEGLSAEVTKKIISDPGWLQGVWEKIKTPDNKNPMQDMAPETGVSMSLLKEVGKALVTLPEKRVLNQRLVRLIKTKAEQLETSENIANETIANGTIDWATGEALAFGTLLTEGYKVRLSGQDVGRGTFSHRHSVWVDQETEEKYVPLNNISATQAKYEVIDSPLAEASVLGFEYGVSLADPDVLVLWEAQFGDFANGAQMIIDQFISSGEYKWNRLSGLVMLLPHGFEGQGPEHSSARLERYLQLCAEGNMRVVNCSTPANYFHALRRQLLGQTRKPLIVMAPKTLLRHKHAVSSLNDMVTGTQFTPVYPEKVVKPEEAKRVVLCSGKVYYELLQERDSLNLKDVALVRLEQYYPFPEQYLIEALKPYAQAEFIWCQEEPMNMGAWNFLDRRLDHILRRIGSKQTQFFYAGRVEAASPATGNGKRHEAEQLQLVHDALIRDEKSFSKISVL
ncbi:2-oxoglutarate dehydrogenase E1 component [Candidatus Paracaedibacter symbiosus]|uniref:2-oxoglutarate dehydrogenase E1 component n=1 Tax=Candidatus Paracaedibacter symbiosus TaxID=244582 RepID=UPI000689861D|nr:2-oxoglutarate dehydrogenase E1 component [Candidatus Paracaedibacter symbiosus]